MLAFDDEPTASSSARVAAYRARSAAERAEAIEQLGALMCAAQAELLAVITAADAEQDWRVDGATAMAPWLVGTLHVSSDTARAWVSTGAKLDALPCLRDAFAAGLLSWDQVHPAATFVTPATDADQAQHLPGCSAAQIADLARQQRIRTRDDAGRSARLRRFGSRPDHLNGGRRYSGHLPEDLAARVDAELDRRAEALGPDAETGQWDPLDVRRADALVAMCDEQAAANPDPESALVVVHVDADVVDGKVAGNGQIEGLEVAAESVLRLLCDAKVEFAIDGPDGTTIGIGRASRVLPPWLRRRIRRRDSGCCRFPGCESRIRHVHHSRHWVRDRGPTLGTSLVANTSPWTGEGFPTDVENTGRRTGHQASDCGKALVNGPTTARSWDW